MILRGVRRRLALALAAWLCAVVVVAGAALGATFARAAAESDLQDVLRADPAGSSIRLIGRVDGSSELTPAQALQRVTAAHGAPRSGFYPSSTPSLLWSTDTTRLVWRPGACAAMRIIRGRCPTGPGEAMASPRSQAPLGWDFDRSYTLYTSSGDSIPMRIVGVYLPRDTNAPIWAGYQYFQNAVIGEAVVTDSLFVTRSTMAALPASAVVQATVDELIVPSRVRLDDRSAALAQQTAIRRWSAEHGLDFAVSSGLPRVLDRAAGQAASIAASTTMVVLQLCVLGWLVLFQVLRDAVEGRSGDIVLAKLRGYGGTALLGFVCTEPLVLLAAALGPGVLLGWGSAVLIAGAVLLPGTPAVLPAIAFPAIAVAVAGGVVAVALSSVRVLRRSVVAQWRSTRATPASARRAAIVEAALVIAALGGFAALRLVGPERAGPLVLLAPGLLLIAAGVICARLLPLLLRPAVSATRARRRIGLLLAVRQVVRRPAGLRLVALLTVAVGLATFGACGEVIAAQNRQARAAVEVGASAVQRITFVPGEDPVAQLRKADPDGRWSAAAAKWITFGGTAVRGYVLAVDTTHLSDVLTPVPGVQDAATLRRGLAGDVAPIRVRGTRLSLRIAASALVGRPPDVHVQVRTAAGTTVDAGAGPLQAGTGWYTADVPCTAGCTLQGVTWLRSPFATGRTGGTATLSALRIGDREVVAPFRHAGAWRSAIPLGSASDRVSITPEGVVDVFTSEDGGSGGVVSQAFPVPVPTVVTAGTVSSVVPGARLRVTSSADRTMDLVVLRRVSALPVILDQGVLVDLGAFASALPTFEADAAWSIWLGPRAPRDATARLAHAGLALDGRPTLLTDRVAALGREAPALALLLLLVAAVSGAICAVGGVTVSIGAAVRRRSYEAAALTVVGVTRAQLYRAAFAEQALLLGSAVVLGVPAGLLAVVLAMPALPQSATPTPVPQASLPPVWPVLLVAVVFAVLVLAAVAISADRVLRAARLSRLREAEE